MQVTAEMAACGTVDALLLPGVQALAWAALLVLVLLVGHAGQLACGWLPSRDDLRQISVMCHDIVVVVMCHKEQKRVPSNLLYCVR